MDEDSMKTFKFLIVGDSSVGKSALLMRFTDNAFSETYISTLGIDFKTKIVDICNEKVKLQIWDSAGQERFRTITKSFFRNAAGIVLAYSVTDMASFKNVTSWIKSIDESVKREDVEVFLVGNKIDLEEKRTVPTDEGKDLAKTFGVKFLETSAKTGENVEKVFSELAKDVYKKQNAEPPREAAENQTKATGNVAIGSQGTTKSNGCC